MNKIKSLFAFLIISTSVYCQTHFTVEIDYNNYGPTSKYRSGVTHTQETADPWGKEAALVSAKNLLEQSCHYQNQHIMGWGAGNPWPDSTVTNSDNWDWNSLDRRINLMRETNGELIITLCGCPTWMHSPEKNGTTDWNELEAAPKPERYKKFAHLCAEVARRYPDVENFQVWNEMKGFWNSSLNRWDYEGYTKMYNLVYDSLMIVNPNLKLGGPYPVVSTYSTKKSFTSNIGGTYGWFDQRPLDVITYWLNNKKGGHFICIDGNTKNKDDIWNTNAIDAADKFKDISDWIRTQPNGGAELDIWWSEWYATPSPSDEADNPDALDAIMSSCLIKTIQAGVANVLIWQPEGDADGFSHPLGIWTSTKINGGGQATPYYDSHKILNDYFGSGTELVNYTVDKKGLNLLVSRDDIFVVNELNQSITVSLDQHGDISLLPYETKLLGNYTNIINTYSHNQLQVSYSSENQLLTIDCKKQRTQALHVEIYTINGRLIFKDRLNKPNERQSINISHLKNGMYIYRIVGENQSLLNGKFIKQ
ncbi:MULTISPECIES: T9SS type A sorting domain-containing protein [unclassified Carboxylicivirga]|uniref:T9SS type A sorting domain-containing protein n=1 Tax=Carboxylicivirga TaxID=1628153 RepID=UPI003D356EDA